MRRITEGRDYVRRKISREKSQRSQEERPSLMRWILPAMSKATHIEMIGRKPSVVDVVGLELF